MKITLKKYNTLRYYDENGDIQILEPYSNAYDDDFKEPRNIYIEEDSED